MQLKVPKGLTVDAIELGYQPLITTEREYVFFHEVPRRYIFGSPLREIPALVADDQTGALLLRGYVQR
jgi:hypothetical protein